MMDHILFIAMVVIVAISLNPGICTSIALFLNNL